MPEWLTVVAIISLAIGGICALIVLADIGFRSPQHMWIMNVVWPITPLYSGPLGLWAYFRAGRKSSQRAVQEAKAHGEKPPGKKKPMWSMTAIAATHCGAGCTLGDICAESLMAVVPLVIFGKKIFGSWVVDFAFAYVFGIVFQYFTIVPMRNLGVGKGIWAAIKADTLSLCAWQVGMYGWMAIATFAIFGHEIEKSDPVFWFMMQIAMLAGFLTAYPVNMWLLKKGIKEKM